jgi:predicted dienelactone hydrolase
MRRAASAENLKLRIGDIHRVLDELNTWNTLDGHSLAHRLNLEQVGMSGHSFGAITAQAVGGQKLVEDGDLRDPRIRAVVALSPSSPRVGDPATAFASVSIPWLMMTGTKDVVTMFKADLESRLGVYRNLPVNNDRYELVLHEAEHSAFTDVRMAWDRGERNPNHHRAVLAISTAFWDYYLLGNAEAGAWLDGDQVRSVLEKQDAWQWAAAGSPVKQPDQVGSDEDLQPVGPQSDEHK